MILSSSFVEILAVFFDPNTTLGKRYSCEASKCKFRGRFMGKTVVAEYVCKNHVARYQISCPSYSPVIRATRIVDRKTMFAGTANWRTILAIKVYPYVLGFSTLLEADDLLQSNLRFDNIVKIYLGNFGREIIGF